MSLTTSIPVLRVSEYAGARQFWCEVLGFQVVEEGGDPPGFGILRQDAAQVFLEAWQGREAPYDRWRAYFHTDDLDAVAERLNRAGQPFVGPTRTPYGMDEIEVTDPDGNVVCFGFDPE